MAKNPKRPLAMRMYRVSEDFKQHCEKIRADAMAGSVNRFFLLNHLNGSLKLLDERDALMAYATNLEKQRRKLKRSMGKTNDRQ